MVRTLSAAIPPPEPFMIIISAMPLASGRYRSRWTSQPGPPRHSPTAIAMRVPRVPTTSVAPATDPLTQPIPPTTAKASNMIEPNGANVPAP